MDTAPLIEKARRYCAAEHDARFRREVEVLLEEEHFEELNDRFYTSLSFGTGGLRGIIGGGFNRMNPFTVRQATQGLADYILAAGGATPLVVIAYDSRHHSDTFALEAALVLCGNGITVRLFTSLRPTPQLSFAVRHYGATAGIVVTASHNPATYNGYKVYWSDGGQIVAPHDSGIISRVKQVDPAAIRVMPRDEALHAGRLIMIDTECDERYIAQVKSQALRPQLIEERGNTLTVVYTPLHGAGRVPLVRALEEMGIAVTLVPQQAEPDGAFPTVTFPNPEEAPAMALALELGTTMGADLVLGTDPDADRLGIAVPDNGHYRLLDGNQLGALLADYLFSTRAHLGTLPPQPALVKSIVTSDLLRRIAQAWGAACFDTLTGFKYIAAKILEFETGTEGYTYIFGAEESYGYLAGTAVRDKDAISAATISAEMALYHVSQGRTLIDALENIWKRYGYFEEGLVATYFEGEQGVNTMNALMESLRSTPPATLGGEEVLTVYDYRDSTVLDVRTGSRSPGIHLPSSNVLQFFTAAGSRITARPSGTEPKIKFYCSCCSEPGVDLGQARAQVGARAAAIMSELRALTATPA